MDDAVRDRNFAAFLHAALDAIAADAPQAYRAVGRALGERTVGMRVDGEGSWLAIRRSRHVVGLGSVRAQVDLVTDSRGLRLLLDGSLGLADAAVQGLIVLRGSGDDLAALHDALLAFLHGAARSPSVPELLDDYFAQARDDEADAERQQKLGGDHVSA